MQTLSSKLAPQKPAALLNPSETEEKLLDQMRELKGWMGKKDREEELRQARSEGVEKGRKEMEKESQQRGAWGWNGSGWGLSSGVAAPMGGGGPDGDRSGHGPNTRPRNWIGCDPYTPQNSTSSRRRSSASSAAKALGQKLLDRVDGLGKDIEKVSDRVRDFRYGERQDREQLDLEDELRRVRFERDRDMERYFFERERWRRESYRYMGREERFDGR